jgi:hypothetical protein
VTVTPLRPKPLRAVIYTPQGQVVVMVENLADLAAEAIKRGLVKVR